MASDTVVTLAWATAIFALAGVVKGVVGMGLPTVAMGLLALHMPPAQAATLLIVPSLLTNLWQAGPWRTAGPLLRRLAPLLAGVVLGTLAGGWAFGALAGPWARAALGGTLIVYGAWGLVGPRLTVPERNEAPLGLVVGAITGVVTAATGVFVVPAVPYLQALHWQATEDERQRLVQALGMAFTVSTLALAAILPASSATGGRTTWWLSCAMLLPALVGMGLGTALRNRLSPVAFRRCFLLGLVLLGGHMVFTSLR